jgi:hypothetical protein
MKKSIYATPQPNGDGLQVTYELGNSRKLHRFPRAQAESEKPPHGAGSFHDPEQHYDLMERVDAMIQAERESK